eukprot:g29968.t1
MGSPGKPGAKLWRRHVETRKAQSKALAEAWGDPESPERESGEGMGRPGKPGAGIWRRHVETRKARSEALAEACGDPESPERSSGGGMGRPGKPGAICLFVQWLGALSYREMLSRLRLFSLERQRLRGDLIEAYKIMRSMDR